MKSWLNTRPTILPIVLQALQTHPDYEVTLVGHSLGGAVATLAGLEMRLKGWDPLVTTFGAPMVGNAEFAAFLDDAFQIGKYDHSHSGAGEDPDLDPETWRIRRVTHVDDPVPLLPLREWGYAPHAAEVYISRPALPPAREDVRVCQGDEDVRCIAGAEGSAASVLDIFQDLEIPLDIFDTRAKPCLTDEEVLSQRSESGQHQQVVIGKQRKVGVAGCASRAQDETAPLYPRHWDWSLIPARYRLWELFYAHRDYFWRIGLCVPGGDLFG